MNPLISLVVPVYNVEKYLDKCMDSVLAQTYDNFEVILVDDGSTDNSGKMCDEYAERDSRVTVYHKPNGGLSDARNFGVEHCNADLVSFVDSDDYITCDYLQYLYSLRTEYNGEIVYAQKRLVTEKTDVKKILESEKKVVVKKLTIGDALCDICLNAASACARLYNKDILLKHPFPVGKLYEDLATTYKLVAECRSIVCSTKIIYFYLSRSGSIRYSKMDENQFHIFASAEEVYGFVKKYYPEVVPAAEVKIAAAAVQLLTTTSIFKEEKNSKNYFYRIQKYVKQHISSVYRSQKPFYFKLSCFVVMLGYYPSKLLLPLREKIKRVVLDLKNN